MAFYDKTDFNLDRIANYIIGHSIEPHQYFLGEIINGPIDADKLDYVKRDGYFAGLPLIYDLDRLMFFLRVAKSKDNLRWRLVVDIRSLPALEQFIMNRLTLYGRMYHHQKINAVDCMFISYIMTIKRCKIRIGHRCLRKPTDFLYVTDDTLLTFHSNNPKITEYQKRLRDRKLLRRALKITHANIKKLNEGDSQVGERRAKLYKFIGLYKDFREIDRVRKEIHKALPRKVRGSLSVEDIWLFIPKMPKIEETQNLNILTDNGLMDVEELSRLGKWVETYETHQWASYVYTINKYVKAVNKASIKVLKKMYDIELYKQATNACKL